MIDLAPYAIGLVTPAQSIVSIVQRCQLHGLDFKNGTGANFVILAYLDIQWWAGYLRPDLFVVAGRQQQLVQDLRNLKAVKAALSCTNVLPHYHKPHLLLVHPNFFSCTHSLISDYTNLQFFSTQK